MKAKLICYSLGKVSLTTRRNFQRELYGYKDISNHSKYSYQRKGLVHRIKCRKVMNSVILITERNAPQLIKLLNKYKANVHVFVVLLKKKL